MSTTVGEYVVRSLESFGVRAVFGIPGHHILELYRHLDDVDLVHVMGKHEEGAVRAAAAYGRAGDGPGVAFASAGPGAINATSAIGEARALSLPLVVFVGGEAQRDGPHSTGEPQAVSTMLHAMAKHHLSVDQPGEIEWAVTEAFELATSGRPGPVTVQIPKDAMKATIDVDGLAAEPERRETFHPRDDEIEAAASRLSSSRRPLIVVGQGGTRARLADEVDALAERLDAPVAVTQRGFGGYVNPERYLGGLAPTVEHDGATRVGSEADLLVLVGVRESLRRFYADRYDCPMVCLTEELERHDRVDEMVAGSLATSLERLTADAPEPDSRWWPEDALRAGASPDAEGPLAIHASDGERDAAGRRRLHPRAVVDALNDLKDGDAIITTDVGMHNVAAMAHVELTEPYTFLGPENWGAMGHALPAAVGAKVANPDTQVIAIVGDGSFLMTPQSFKTAVEYDLDVAVVVCNNNQHNAIFADMRAQFGESAHTDVPGLDYATYAESAFGTGLRVSGPSDLESTLESALTAGEPTIVDVPVVPDVER